MATNNITISLDQLQFDAMLSACDSDKTVTEMAQRLITNHADETINQIREQIKSSLGVESTKTVEEEIAERLRPVDPIEIIEP